MSQSDDSKGTGAITAGGARGVRAIMAAIPESSSALQMTPYAAHN